jgi:uncharacterized membrane protein YczE
MMMKKIKRASELLWVLGTIFVALGVALCSKANLGVSMIAAPAFVVQEAIVRIFESLSVGATEYIIQAILLVVLCLIVGRFNWRYLLAFAVAVIYGYTLDIFLWMLSGVTVSSVWLRWILLLVGDMVTGFGVACYFRTYMPLQVYELFVAELADRFHFSVNKTKCVFDIISLVISVVLALTLYGDASTFDWSTIGYQSFHSIGLGTLVTTAINSLIIGLMGKLIDRIFEQTPRFPQMEQILKRH